MKNEPKITVCGVDLDVGQAMSVRVAITSMHADMAGQYTLSDDEMERKMAKAYSDRLTEVLRIIFCDKSL